MKCMVALVIHCTDIISEKSGLCYHWCDNTSIYQPTEWYKWKTQFVWQRCYLIIDLAKWFCLFSFFFMDSFMLLNIKLRVLLIKHHNRMNPFVEIKPVTSPTKFLFQIGDLHRKALQMTKNGKLRQWILRIIL